VADTFTTNLALLIADLTDGYAFNTHVEANLTTIDGLMGLVKCTSGTRPSNTYGGQGIYETDTGRVAVNSGTKASPVWTYVSSNVLVYTSSTRPSTNLIAGLLIYESDTDALVRYTGSAWRYATLVKCTAATRPTTGIAAGTAIYESDTTRMLVYNGSSWEQKAFGQFVCTAATHPSSPFQGLEIFETDTGVSAVYSGSGYLYNLQQIATVTLGASAASIAFSGLPAVTHLVCDYSLRSDTGSGGQAALLRINGDSATNYNWQDLHGSVTTTTSVNSTSATGIRFCLHTGTSDGASNFVSGRFDIPNANGATNKTVTSSYVCSLSNSTVFSGNSGGTWNNQSVITSLTLLPASGNFVAHSTVSLYAMM
jgi:hypothetical protein